MAKRTKFVTFTKILATIAFGTLQYLFIPFGGLSGIFTGIIIYGIWSPIFGSESDKPSS